MKMDRLIGITMYLLNRNVVSAKELAERFEVSVRTIVRDMDVLSIAGIPISSQTGALGDMKYLIPLSWISKLLRWKIIFLSLQHLKVCVQLMITKKSIQLWKNY